MRVRIPSPAAELARLALPLTACNPRILDPELFLLEATHEAHQKADADAWTPPQAGLGSGRDARADLEGTELLVLVLAELAAVLFSHRQLLGIRA